MTTTNRDQVQLPRRLFLVSTPRTASNLLVRVLNIQNQPEVITNEKSGYFFFEPYTAAAAKGYFTKPLSQWTPAEKSEMQTLYQQSLDNLEGLSHQGDKRITWTKEHAFLFVSPAKLVVVDTDANPDHPQEEEEEDDKPSFSLTFPDIYKGSNGTGTFNFSQHNNTLFPDEYLATWKFAFLIRHPALAWPSMLRALRGLSTLGMLGGGEQGAASMKAAQQTNMTWKWARDLYQWCCEHQMDHDGNPNNKPVILDAHDVIHDPRVVLKFCEETGLDKSVLQFEWDMPKFDFGKPEEDGDGRHMQTAAEFMTETLRVSRGVIKDKAPLAIDIDAEAEKWKVEFGEDVAGKLEQAVRDAMPDYEYLRGRRLTVTG